MKNLLNGVSVVTCRQADRQADRQIDGRCKNGHIFVTFRCDNFNKMETGKGHQSPFL
jgi:hypothetical protein